MHEQRKSEEQFKINKTMQRKWSSMMNNLTCSGVSEVAESGSTVNRWAIGSAIVSVEVAKCGKVTGAEFSIVTG
jgi:hypothetical protein